MPIPNPASVRAELGSACHARRQWRRAPLAASLDGFHDGITVTALARKGQGSLRPFPRPCNRTNVAMPSKRHVGAGARCAAFRLLVCSPLVDRILSRPSDIDEEATALP